MKRYIFLIILLLVVMVSPALAYYQEYIWDDGYSGIMTNNNSVNLTLEFTGWMLPSDECIWSRGTNYSNCDVAISPDKNVLSSFDGKNGVLNISTNFSTPVNITLDILSGIVGGENIWQYEPDSTVAFHTSFKISNVTGLTGGDVHIYRDGNSTTGVLVYNESFLNTTDWQYHVWYGWDETMDASTTFDVYLFFDNWLEMPVGTEVYIDDLRFFTVETELASPSSPSLSARRDMCEATAELGTLDCQGCGSFGASNVSGHQLAGNIHKSMDLGGDAFIPCITLYYNGITTSRIPIGYLDDDMYDTAFGRVYGTPWIRAWFHATTQDYKYIYNFYQVGTTPYYYYLSTLLFGMTETEVEMTTFNSVGGISSNGAIECSVSGSVPQSVLSAGTMNLWRETIDISSYGCTGDQFRFYNYGANEVNAKYTSNWMDIPFTFAPVCDEGWYCAGNQQYYLLPDCEVTNIEACGSCGCDDEYYKCQSAETYVECVNSVRISFYENCTETDSFLCDIECISAEGDDYCLGETVCADAGDCPSAICFGNTRYYDAYCDGGTNSCKYYEDEECTYSCIAGICTAGEVSPAFEDTSPTGIIQTLKDGVVGFVSGMANPFFYFVILIVAVMMITGLIGVLFGGIFKR